MNEEIDKSTPGLKKLTRREFIKSLALASAAVGVAGIAGCAGTPPATSPPPVATVSSPPRETPTSSSVSEVLIGSVLPLTGGAAFEGGQAFKGLTLGIEDINAAGGIRSLGGAKLKLLSKDDQGKVEVATSVSEQLRDAGVKGFFGTMQSAVAAEIGKITEQAQIPFIVHAGSADFLTQSGFKYLFRTQPTGTQFTQSAVDSIINLSQLTNVPVKNVGLLADNSQGYAPTVKAVKDYVPTKGLTLDPVLDFTLAQADFTTEITKLKAASPDVVIAIAFFADSVNIVRTMQQLQFNTKAIVGIASAFSNPNFPTEAGATLAQGLMDSNYWYNPKSPRIEAIKANCRKMFNEEFSSHMAMAYVAIQVYSAALEAAGSTDGPTLRDALQKTNLSDHILPAGPIQFDANGQIIDSGAAFLQRFGNDMKIILPKQYAEIEPVFPLPEWNKRS